MSGHTCPCSCLCFCEGVKQRPDLGCAWLCHAAKVDEHPTTHRPEESPDE